MFANEFLFSFLLLSFAALLCLSGLAMLIDGIIRITAGRSAGALAHSLKTRSASALARSLKRWCNGSNRRLANNQEQEEKSVSSQHAA